jgi:hypothetical protein
MWERSYTKVYKDVKIESIWKVWEDVSNWHIWDHDIEYAKLEGPFAVGSIINLKPKGGPIVKIELLEVERNRKYIDSAKFFGARLYGIHEVKEVSDGVELTTKIRMTGWLKYLWIKLVAENIAKTLSKQTEALVEVAKQ